MKASEIFALWQNDLSKCSSFKEGKEWTEITLPYATLTGKVVRVFIKTWPNGTHTVSDCGDLAQDTYESGFYEWGTRRNSRAQSNAHVMLGRKIFDDAGIGSFTDHKGQRFLKFVKEPALLSAAIFDMALFIQSAVNCAAFDNSRRETYGLPAPSLPIDKNTPTS